MRHKYHTSAIVLARTPTGEANLLVTLLTKDLGLVRARAQGIRKPSAKLASALTTFAESEVMLVKGAEGWRVASAILTQQWFLPLSRTARLRAARVTGLLLRLVPGETVDATLFPILVGFFEALATEAEPTHDAAECLAALRLLSVLGLDAGALPGTAFSHYDPTLLQRVASDRSAFISRINRGIEASGL